jgi:hypothetical protein
MDGFTSFGIRLFQPDIKEWVEVSVFGDTFEPRPILGDTIFPRYRSHRSPLGNMLVQGSVIDLGGVLVLFQDPIALVHSQQLVTQLYLILKSACRFYFHW